MRKFLLILTGLGFVIVEAGAALTLVIDTSTKTATWSGIATSGVITSPQFTLLKIAVGTGPTSNPTAAVPPVTTTDSALTATLTSDISGSGPGASVGSAPGRLHVDAVEGSLQTLVAEILDFTGGGLTTVELSGDGVPYAYTELEPSQQSALEALHGTELRFRDGNTTGADYGTAGFISVIPEPGAAALLGLGFAALLIRRGRCQPS